MALPDYYLDPRPQQPRPVSPWDTPGGTQPGASAYQALAAQRAAQAQAGGVVAPAPAATAAAPMGLPTPGIPSSVSALLDPAADPMVAGLDPALAATYAQTEALRRLRLAQLRNAAQADVGMLAVNHEQDLRTNQTQYNRETPLVAASYLSRGLGESGITNTGIAQYHRDYQMAQQRLDTSYAQTRAKLLQQIADAEAEASLGSSMDALGLGSDNWTKVLDLVSRYS